LSRLLTIDSRLDLSRSRLHRCSLCTTAPSLSVRLYWDLVGLMLEGEYCTRCPDNRDDLRLGGEPASSGLRITLLHHIVGEDCWGQVGSNSRGENLFSYFKFRSSRCHDNIDLLVVIMLDVTIISIVVFSSFGESWRWQYIFIGIEHRSFRHR